MEWPGQVFQGDTARLIFVETLIQGDRISLWCVLSERKSESELGNLAQGCDGNSLLVTSGGSGRRIACNFVAFIGSKVASAAYACVVGLGPAYE